MIDGINKIHWFKDRTACETYFARCAKNIGKEFSPEFVFEGNSNVNFQYVIDVANVIGWENIGVAERWFERDDLDHIDELYFRIRGEFPRSEQPRVFLDADEVSIEADGTIRVWWD